MSVPPLACTKPSPRLQDAGGCPCGRPSKPEFVKKEPLSCICPCLCVCECVFAYVTCV